MADEGQIAWAYIKYRQAVSLYPGPRERAGSAQIHVAMGGVHPDIAVEAVEFALRSDPNNAVLLSHYAVHEIRRGNIAQAEEAYTTMLSLFPDFEQTAFVGNMIEEAR